MIYKHNRYLDYYYKKYWHIVKGLSSAHEELNNEPDLIWILIFIFNIDYLVFSHLLLLLIFSYLNVFLCQFMWSEWYQLSILSLVELGSCLSFSSLSCFSFCRDCWPMNGTVLWPPLLSALQSGLCAAHVPLWMHWPAVCESREGGAAHRGRGGNRAMSPQFRIAVLGAQGVGKTAIVKRFLHNDYSEVAVSSKTRRVHLSAAVLNGHVHDLQITDYPAISSFPGSSLQVRYPTYHKIWLWPDLVSGQSLAHLEKAHLRHPNKGVGLILTLVGT